MVIVLQPFSIVNVTPLILGINCNSHDSVHRGEYSDTHLGISHCSEQTMLKGRFHKLYCSIHEKVG